MSGLRCSRREPVHAARASTAPVGALARRGHRGPRCPLLGVRLRGTVIVATRHSNCCDCLSRYGLLMRLPVQMRFIDATASHSRREPALGSEAPVEVKTRFSTVKKRLSGGSDNLSRDPVAFIGKSDRGAIPRPGEISLAHNGVLLLDEAAEFARHALDALRQPLEEGAVQVARAARTVVFPAASCSRPPRTPCILAATSANRRGRAAARRSRSPATGAGCRGPSSTASTSASASPRCRSGRLRRPPPARRRCRYADGSRRRARPSAGGTARPTGRR